MGFPKSFEDNLEIAEERLWLRQHEEDGPLPIYNVPRKISYPSPPVFKKVAKTPPVPPQKDNQPDKKLICCECLTPFLFTKREQKYYEKNNLSQPKRCAVCRRERKSFFISFK